jgi:hypothetical protein
VGTATGDWFAELIKDDAWFKEVVPNVSIHHRIIVGPSS